MQIDNEKSVYLASYLGKGALIEKNREISIQIGDKAEIGIGKRGRKYAIFVKYDGRYDRTANVSMFNEKISVPELATLIKTALEQSIALSNVELDMKKVPMITNPVTNPELGQDDFFKPVKNESDEDDLSDFAGMFGDTDTDSTETIDDISAPVSSPSDVPIQEPQDETDDDLTEDNSISAESSINNTASNAVPLQPSDTDSKQTSAQENEISDGYDSDEKYFDKEDSIAVDMDESFSTQPNEYESDADTDTAVESKIDKNVSLLLNKEHLLPSRPKTSIAENSYLYQMIGDETEIKEKMVRICEQLTDMDRELITTFYISALSSLLALYDNDIQRLSDDVQIDKRDIMLALYESKFL